MRNCSAVVLDKETVEIGSFTCNDFEGTNTAIIKEDIVVGDKSKDGGVITTLDVAGQPEPNSEIIKEDIVSEDETTDGSVTEDLNNRPGPVHLENEVSNTAVSILVPIFSILHCPIVGQNLKLLLLIIYRVLTIRPS